GDNHAGQLGVADVVGKLVPQSIGLPVVNFSAGSNHSAALCADGTLNVWGANNFGQLGNGGMGSSSLPVALTIENVKAVAAGWDHLVILRGSGVLQSWGLNDHYQLGAETLGGFSDVPVDVLPPEEVEL